MLNPTTSGLAKAVKIYLDVTWFVVLIGGICLVVLTPIVIVSLPSADEAPYARVLARFSLDPSVVPVRTSETMISADPFFDSQADLRIRTRSRLVWTLNLLVIFPVLAVILYAVWQLRALFRSIVGGKPFAPENTARVRRVGLVVVGWNLIAPVAKYLVGLVVVSRVRVPGLILRPPIDLDLNVIFLGLAILVLGEIFHRASLLQEEQSLTV